MAGLDGDALRASGEDQPAATQGTPTRSKAVASPGESAGGSWRPWLVTVVFVVGAMAIISGISHLAEKAASPNIAFSDR